MAIKLIKACKELNISSATFISWCENNGYSIEWDPNYRLDDELYLQLAKQFNYPIYVRIRDDYRTKITTSQQDSTNLSIQNFDWNAYEAEASSQNQVDNFEENTIVEGTITSINKREVVVSIGFKADGIISAEEFRYNPELKVGDKIEVYIISKEDKKGQFMLSHKEARIRRAWERIENAYNTGEIVSSYIKWKTKGGLIVDVLGMTAFLPGSQIDVKPIRDFDAFVGKTIEVKVTQITPESHNVVVSHRAIFDNRQLKRTPLTSHDNNKPTPSTPKQEPKSNQPIVPATSDDIQNLWKYYIEIQKYLLDQKSLPINIKPETIDFRESEGKFYVEVDDINETKLQNLVADELGIDNFDPHTNCFQVDNVLWQSMSQDDKEALQYNLSELSADLEIVPSIEVLLKYGQNIERVDQMTLEDIRQLDQAMQDGSKIRGHIDDTVAFISKLKFDLDYHVHYLFGDNALPYKHPVGNRYYWDLRYTNAYIQDAAFKEYGHNIGLVCTNYRLIFRIKDNEALSFLRDHYEVYDKLTENSVAYSKKYKAFVFERSVARRDKYKDIIEKEIQSNINIFLKGLGAYYTGSNVEIDCEFNYTFPCDMLEEYLCRLLYDHISASSIIGVSLNPKTKNIGIDFNWREESIREKINKVKSLMPGVILDLQEGHRFKCRVQNSYVGFEELKQVLSSTFENIRITNDELTQTIRINLEYEYDFYSNLRKMLVSKLELLGYDKSQMNVSKNESGKVRLSFSYNDKERIKDIEYTLEELRLTDFAFETREGSVPFGRLLRVDYPTLLFDVTYPRESQKSKIDDILISKNASTVVPILTGDREKLARLQTTYSKALNGEGLQNGNLSKFMFDSSLATVTPDIEYFTKADGANYQEMMRNQLNAHINKSQMEAIIKAMNAQDLAVIQGPPGTGKSTAISELIWQLIRRGEKQGNASERILLTSETNLAVDNAIARTVNNKTNLIKPIRFGDDEKLASEGLQFSLRLMQEWVENGDIALENNGADEETGNDQEKSNLILKNWLSNISNRSFNGVVLEGTDIVERWRHVLTHPSQEIRRIVLKNYEAGCNVIGATCSSIGINRADNDGITSFYRTYSGVFKGKMNLYDPVTFTTVIQDESSKATPAELIQPFIYGQRAIVIGDHRQLPPMLDQEEIEESLKIALKKAQTQEETKTIKHLQDLVHNNFKELEISHFQRLYENIDASLKGTFNMQYRMHPDINEVIEQFYVNDGGLKCGWTTPKDQGINDPNMSNPASRYHGINIEGLLDENTHVLFINTETPEMLDGTSRVNYGEIEAIDKLLSRFEQSDSYKQYLSHFTTDEEKQIGIISFYGKQVRQLQTVARKHSHSVPSRVSTVDRFQGMERNIVIVSMVRSDRIQTSRNQLPNKQKYPETGGYPRQKSLGFAQSPNRLNVALSRARRLLVIVGNERLFMQKDIYKNLFQTIRNNPNNHVIEAYKL